MTVDRAQALGEQFCKKAVSRTPSHCLHPPGRTQPQRQYPCAYRYQFSADRGSSVPALHGQTGRHPGGCKHRCTNAAMEYFKAEVMEMCHRENLYQIDLLHGSKNRITEREYWAQRKGQAKPNNRPTYPTQCASAG